MNSIATAVGKGCLLSHVLFYLSLEFVKAHLKSLCKQLKLLYRSMPILTLTSYIMVIYFVILIHTGTLYEWMHKDCGLVHVLFIYY